MANLYPKTSPVSSNQGGSNTQYVTGNVGAETKRRYEQQGNKARSGEFLRDPVVEDTLTTEKYNLNAGYLLMLARLIDEFIVIKCNSMTASGRTNPDVYYQMWEQLDMIENILACKQKAAKRDEIKVHLDEALVLIKQVGGTSEVGQFVDVDVYIKTRKLLGQLFEDLTTDMENRGMLTFRAEDPLKAMAKFTD
jgi:hypothetical protein